MDSDTKRILWGVTCFVVTMLLAGNVFFVRRLVDKLDSQQEIMWSLRQDVVILKITIEEMRGPRILTKEFRYGRH